MKNFRKYGIAFLIGVILTQIAHMLHVTELEDVKRDLYKAYQEALLNNTYEWEERIKEIETLCSEE